MLLREKRVFASLLLFLFVCDYAYLFMYVYVYVYVAGYVWRWCCIILIIEEWSAGRLVVALVSGSKRREINATYVETPATSPVALSTESERMFIDADVCVDLSAREMHTRALDRR